MEQKKQEKINKFKISPLDLQILGQLNLNARNSLRKIGENLDQGKSKIGYHLKKFEEGNLVQYKPLVNTRLLKLERALLLVQTSDKQSENDLIKHWKTCPFVLHVYPLLGYRYSLALILIAPKIEEFQIFIEECEVKPRDVFSGHILIPIVASHLPTDFLYESVRFFKNKDNEHYCSCTGCNSVWNNYFNLK